MKNYKFLLTIVAILACSYGNSMDVKKTFDLVRQSISMIDQEYKESDAKNNKFEALFPEKNGEMLLFKRFSDKDFWETCLVYVKNNKNEAVTYAIVKDYPKAKQNCKNLILLLTSELGNSFTVKTTKLDSSISESLPGYAMIWEKDNINIALKFGPLEKEVEKFQLQISIYKADDKMNLIGIDKNSKLDSAGAWETIKQYYSLK